MKTKGKKRTLILILLIVTGLSIFIVYKYIEYQNSIPYQLGKLGYKKEEIQIIQKRIKNIDKILHIKYDNKLINLINETYFIEENLDAYIEYYNQHPNTSWKDVITIIHAKTNLEPYQDAENADTSKNEKILVNKHYAIDETFVPTNIVDINPKYAYANNQISKEIYDIYTEMCDQAAIDGISLVATSGYRSYEDQKKIYDSYVTKYGMQYADEYAARPGFSEHQTGLAIDIIGMGTTRDTFEDSDAFLWLQEHAAEYGFILRFPKGKEHITGYAYEPWHYRYVGKHIAQKLKRENITYEEYYTFYIK